MPINIAAFASPLKYNISENISEAKAESNNKISVVVNFLNIFQSFFKFFIVQYSSKLTLLFWKLINEKAE